MELFIFILICMFVFVFVIISKPAKVDSESRAAQMAEDDAEFEADHAKEMAELFKDEDPEYLASRTAKTAEASKNKALAEAIAKAMLDASAKTAADQACREAIEKSQRWF